MTCAAPQMYVDMHKNIDTFIKTANAAFKKQVHALCCVLCSCLLALYLLADLFCLLCLCCLLLSLSLSLQGYPLELANWFSVWSMMYTQEGRYHWMLQYYMRDAGVALS